MTAAILTGMLAALNWSVHDLLARSLAGRVGPFRLAAAVMVLGGLLLTPFILWKGSAFAARGVGLGLSLALGAAYGMGIGGLYKAFSMGPVSVVAPLTASYPAVVMLWGVLGGLRPSLLQWLSIAVTLAGAIVISRSGHEDGGINAVARGKLFAFISFCVISLLGFASAFILGQNAAVAVGEVEAAWISRLTAALAILPFLVSEAKAEWPVSLTWLLIAAMAFFDVAGLIAMNASGHLPNREFASVGISTYAAIAVVLSAIFLKEKVSLGQWAGIAMIVAGIATLSVSQ
jgi:drug/metabolite transporter (DMT)-like permease